MAGWKKCNYVQDRKVNSNWFTTIALKRYFQLWDLAQPWNACFLCSIHIWKKYPGGPPVDFFDMWLEYHKMTRTVLRQVRGNLIFYYVIKVVWMHCFWTYERFPSLARRYDSEKHPWNDSKLYNLSRSRNVALHSRWYISRNNNSACVLNFLWYNWMIKCNTCIIWMI